MIKKSLVTIEHGALGAGMSIKRLNSIARSAGAAGREDLITCSCGSKNVVSQTEGLEADRCAPRTCDKN